MPLKQSKQMCHKLYYNIHAIDDDDDDDDDEKEEEDDNASEGDGSGEDDYR